MSSNDHGIEILRDRLRARDGTGIMVCGHGSRDQNAVEEFSGLAARIGQMFEGIPVEYGYLEFAKPVLRDGLDRLIAKGARDILAVPAMLFAAGHAKNDIPSVLNTYAASHPDIRICYGSELGIDSRMLKAAAARIDESIEQFSSMSREETLLVVVGRGASDPDANSNVAKVMRMLWEGRGFGWGETAYSGVTFPLVAPALEHVVRLGYRQIVVFPYFLFTGILVKRIYDACDEVARTYPDIKFIKAPYLGAHDLVVQTFAARISDIIDGNGLMNCQLCKYREQILGFEEEVGLAQASHHHHVEGIGVGEYDDSVIHTHSHSDANDHGHHHPYPHRNHPLGPRTLYVGSDE
jgi:sirohydrochlorin cobaltochelatase